MVVSPHLDDGVFACGDLLAGAPGSFVLTVFAGRPRDHGSLTGWDADAGFQQGDDVMACRRREDAEALRILGAAPIWLDFLDSQYGDAQYRASPAPSRIAEAVARAITDRDIERVFIPLGLFHSDHRLTTRAALRALRLVHGVSWLAYADALYRAIPGLLDRRLKALARLRFHPVPLAQPRAASELKQQAVHAYASQLRALSTTGRLAYEGAFVPEQYWKLECT